MDADRVAKLMAFAQQDVSPRERDVARDMLAAEGHWPPPPRPPTAVGGSPFRDDRDFWSFFSSVFGAAPSPFGAGFGSGSTSSTAGRGFTHTIVFQDGRVVVDGEVY